MMREGTVWLLRVVVVAAIAFHAAPARADNVDTLIKQLDDDSDKIRLSATLNLTKLGDPRAIIALVKHINSDAESDKNVRGAAAVALSKLVTSATKPAIKKLAVSALERAVANDPNEFVKEQAQKALTAITGAAGTIPTPVKPPSGGGGGIYVNVGPMSSKTGSDDAKLQKMMVRVATDTMGKVAGNMPTTWAAGGVPTKAALDAKGVLGFYVDGTLNELKIEKSGSSSNVSCKISMLLASFPDKSVFGFLNGGAKVQASSSPRDVDMAREDCVAAVVEDLIAKKIVPTIKTKAGTP